MLKEKIKYFWKVFIIHGISPKLKDGFFVFYLNKSYNKDLKLRTKWIIQKLYVYFNINLVNSLHIWRHALPSKKKWMHALPLPLISMFSMIGLHEKQHVYMASKPVMLGILYGNWHFDIFSFALPHRLIENY